MKPAVAQDAMVATSQPLATQAGLHVLGQGGNAVDAAIAAAAVLCVTEPLSTGLGGDAFAIVWADGRAEGLDAAGPAPALAEPVEPVALTGPRSVTVPGAVAGWAALADRHGRLGTDSLLAAAIEAAEGGFEAQPRVVSNWEPSPLGEPGAPQPELARTLRAIADDGPEGFYRGGVGEAIANASWLEEDDLAGYEPRWVEPLRIGYRGVEVLELPPPTQGVAALEALGLLELGEPTLAAQIECVRLALDDAFEHVRDGADVTRLLSPGYLARRHGERGHGFEPHAGTTYLCVVDADRMAVSFIQSLFDPWGSRVVAPGTGVVLQNRGACFEVGGRVEPGRRPYHTIIPGLLLRGDALWGPFGVMGGFIQAQAHVQLVSGLVDDGLDPQAALDRPRFRVDGDAVLLEEGLWEQAARIPGARPETDTVFGGGQAILVEGDSLLGGSDRRKDGYAGGL